MADAKARGAEAAAKERIRGIARLQKDMDGSPQNCPRCGRPSIKPRLRTNASSRSADIYVCDMCGNDEAVLDMIGKPKPFAEWAAAGDGFAPGIGDPCTGKEDGA